MENDLPGKGSDGPAEPDHKTVDIGPKPGFPEKKSTLHFEIAIGRNPENVRPGLEERVAAEQVWRDMADGTADRYDRDEWLKFIAKRIVSGVVDRVDPTGKGAGKGSAALIAIRLLGPRYKHSELINDLDTVIRLADLIKPEGKLSLDEMVTILREQRHFEGLKDEKAKKLIQNLLQNRLT